jgi:hypothetical protein
VRATRRLGGLGYVAGSPLVGRSARRSISSASSASSTAQTRNWSITSGSMAVLTRSRHSLARALASRGSRMCLLPKEIMPGPILRTAVFAGRFLSA